MWRFLSNIPRALKNYHGPRASVGVYVDNEEKEQEATVKNEKEALKCAPHPPRQNSCYGFNKDTKARDRTVLWRLASHKNGSHTTDDDESEDKQDWRSSCQRDFLDFLQKYDRMLETLAVGTSYLWGNNHGKKNQKSDLLYRVLFLCCDKEGIGKYVNQQDVSIANIPEQWRQNLLAIKDVEGSAQDGTVQLSKSENVDAALKDFENTCLEYTAQNESLLALGAVDKGKMPEAVEHFRVSCSRGNKSACFNLGLCYETGSGVSRNLDKAKHYYELAALKGHSQAMYNLSLLYLNEDDVEDGNVDVKKGLKFMEMAARSGLVEAQTYMGIHHMNETGNTKMAAAYFKAAAKQNDCDAQYFLALCHEHGLGLEVNECRAAYLYSKAASMGHQGAMFNLATFTENGLGGIPSNVTAAEELYTKAAELGNEDAKNRLEELRTIKHKEEEKAKQALTLEVCSLHLSNASSSPNLSPTDSSFSDMIYHRVLGIFKSTDPRNEGLFDPGGGNQDKVSFYIGCENDERNKMGYVDIRKGEASVCDDKYTYRCSEVSGIHKSSTTPDLTSMVACNI